MAFPLHFGSQQKTWADIITVFFQTNVFNILIQNILKMNWIYSISVFDVIVIFLHYNMVYIHKI